MKTPTAGMAALLASGKPLLLADLYTITPVGGSSLFLSSADAIVKTASAETYLPGPPHVLREGLKSSRGLNVGEMTMVLQADPTSLLNGVPWIQAIRGGALDGATVLVKKAVMDGTVVPAMSAIAETCILFSGRIADVEPQRTQARILVRDDTELLNVQMPRNLYQPPCTNTLYDGGCGVNRATFTTAATATSGSTKTLVIVTGTAQAAGYFNQGVLSCVTGANAGLRRTIKVHAVAAGVQLTLAYPLPYAPTAGDTFTVVPGCNRQQTGDCTTKFSNVANFRGYPYVPIPEAAV